MAIVRWRGIVRGRVQGVFFRDYARREAIRLGLSGWVRNRSDGSVETEFQGEEREVALMAAWLEQGSPLSQVSGVATEACPIIVGASGFEVRY